MLLDEPLALAGCIAATASSGPCATAWPRSKGHHRRRQRPWNTIRPLSSFSSHASLTNADRDERAAQSDDRNGGIW